MVTIVIPLRHTLRLKGVVSLYAKPKINLLRNFTNILYVSLFLGVDIDECALGLSICHPIAVCKNTIMSYKCDCSRPPRSGDGYNNCSGELLNILSTNQVKHCDVMVYTT